MVDEPSVIKYVVEGLEWSIEHAAARKQLDVVDKLVLSLFLQLDCAYQTARFEDKHFIQGKIVDAYYAHERQISELTRDIVGRIHDKYVGGE